MDKFKQRSLRVRVSRKREREIAKERGGVSVSGSGNGEFEKMDIKFGPFLVSHKMTVRKSQSITRSMCKEVINNAMLCDKLPLIILDFEPIIGGEGARRLVCAFEDDVEYTKRGFKVEG